MALQRRHWPAVALPVAVALGLVALVLALAPAADASTTVNANGGPGPTLATTVDCNRGGDLQEATDDLPAAGTTLKIRGTCMGTFTIDKDVTLRGLAKATLDGNGSGPVVTVNGATVALKNLRITGGKASGAFAVGGIFNNEGDLTLKWSRVVGNSATASGPGALAVGGIQTGGAGIEPAGGSLTLIRSIVNGNSGVVTGGALLSAAVGGIIQSPGPNTVRLQRSTVRGNSATASGLDGVTLTSGGIGTLGSLTLVRSAVRRNTSTTTNTGEDPNVDLAGAAGGIGTGEGAEVTLRNSALRGNVASATSPAVAVATGGLGMGEEEATLRESVVAGNTAESSVAVASAASGGITSTGTVSLSESVVRKNGATSAGGINLSVAAGGVLNGFAPDPIGLVTLTNSMVENNAAAAPGGAPIGGIFDLLGGMGITLTASQVAMNSPTNCNFAAPGCVVLDVAVDRAPVSPDGTTAGAWTDFVLTFRDRNPAVEGIGLQPGGTIQVVLPPEFTSRVPVTPPDPAMDNAIILQGWPQSPPLVAGEFPWTVSRVGNTITLTVRTGTTNQFPNGYPVGQFGPGPKQVHLILPTVRNPAEAGQYPVELAIDPDGSGANVMRGVGNVRILPDARPSVNVMSLASGGGPPPPFNNPLYQSVSPGGDSLDVLLYLWDADNAPFVDVGLKMTNPRRGELVQGSTTVGHVSIDPPAGASDFELTTVGPPTSVLVPAAFVTGVPVGTLVVKLLTDPGVAGVYTIKIGLEDGNEQKIRLTAG